MALRMVKVTKLYHRNGLFHFLTHVQIFPSHKFFCLLRILNPVELPGDDWIKQGCWTYEEEKEMLSLKGQLRGSKLEVWGKKSHHVGRLHPVVKKFHYGVALLLLHIMGDRCDRMAMLMLRYLSTVIATSLKEPWDQRAKFSMILQAGGYNAWGSVFCCCLYSQLQKAQVG